jgi:phosphoglycolate phosphatase-like HAD superfamily hydrolase
LNNVVLRDENQNNVKNYAQFIEVYNRTCNLGIKSTYTVFGLPYDEDRNHPVWDAYDKFKKENPIIIKPSIKRMIRDVYSLTSLDANNHQNRRARLGINSSNTWTSIHSELRKSNLLQYFDHYVTIETLREFDGSNTAEKPSKVSVALSLDVANSEGRNVIFVGDTLNDLKACINVRRGNRFHVPQSLITIGVTWGYQSRKILENGVQENGSIHHFNHIVDTPEEITRIVKEEKLKI